MRAFYGVAIAVSLLVGVANAGEVEDLRAEVKRLRAEVKMLRKTNASLIKRLATPATQPATRPAKPPASKPPEPKPTEPTQPDIGHYHTLRAMLKAVPRIRAGIASDEKRTAFAMQCKKMLAGATVTGRFRMEAVSVGANCLYVTGHQTFSCPFWGRKKVRLLIEAKLRAGEGQRLLKLPKGTITTITGTLSESSPITAGKSRFAPLKRGLATIKLHPELKDAFNEPGKSKSVGVHGWDSDFVCLKLTLTNCRPGRK